MFCQECGTQFDGKFCPNCGTPAAKAVSGIPSDGTQQDVFPGPAAQEPGVPTEKKKKPKKKKGKLIPVIILIVLLVSCGALFGTGSGSSGGTSKTETRQTGKSESQASSQPEAEAEGTRTENAEADAQASETPAATSKVVDYTVKQEYFYDYVSSIGTHRASAFVEIENTGTVPLYLSDGKFDIEDNSGHLLKSESLVSTCPDAIFPGETGYFYEDYIDLDDIDTSNGLQFAPHYKVEEAKHDIIDYDVTDLDIREDSMWICMVTGRLTNSEEEKISLIYVNAVYYDADGNTIGISGTNITDIEPGETESFEITGQFFREDIDFSDIAQYMVIPRAWYMQF